MRAIYTTLLTLLMGILPLIAQEHTITVIATPADCGTVYANYETAAVGTPVTIQANERIGCRFLYWSCEGEKVSTIFQYRFDMPDRDVTYYAHFAYDPDSPDEPEADDRCYNLTVKVVPENGGRVSIAKQRNKAGQNFYNTAYPNSGFTFDGWYVDNQLVAIDKTYQFKMPEQHWNMEARFSYNPQNPVSPAANVWQPETGVLDISEFAIGQLHAVLNDVIPYDEREQVQTLILTGEMKRTNNYDYEALRYFKNCTEMDFSRLTGMSYLPSFTTRFDNLQTFHLPSSVTEINAGTFSSCPNLALIFCNQFTPPRCTGSPTNQPLGNITVFVPQQALAAYKTAPYWQEMNIQTTQEDMQSIQINLPDGVDPMSYAGMTLELINCKNGKTNRYVITKQKAYTFQNILPRTEWSALIKNEHNDLFGQIDLIQVENTPVQVTFPKLLSPVDLRLTVKDPAGKDQTNLTSITWLDKDGNYLSNAELLPSQPEGKTLQYRVQTNNEELVTRYILPVNQIITVAKGQPNLTCTLTPYELVTVTGQVKDQATGIPIEAAKVCASQSYPFGYMKTQNATTDKQGRFSLSLIKANALLSCQSQGYQPVEVTWDPNATTGTETQLAPFALQTLSYTNIGINYAYTQTPTQPGGSAMTAEGMSDWRQITYSLYNETQRKPIQDYQVEPANLRIGDAVQPGDRIQITASSTVKAFSPVQETVTIDADGKATVRLPIVSYGSLLADYKVSGTDSIVGLLFNAAGQLVTRQRYQNQTLRMEQLPDGTYTLITLQEDPIYSNISELSYLSQTPLKENEDYASQSVTLASGQLATVSLQEVPAIHKETAANPAISGTFYAHTNRVAQGNYVTLTASVNINKQMASEQSGYTFVLPIPEGMELVTKSIQLGGNTYYGTQEEHQIAIPLSTDNNEIRFCLTATAQGDFTLGAFVQAQDETQSMTYPIGYAAVTSCGLEVNVPTTTTTRQLSLSGTALPLSTVTIWDNGNKIAETVVLGSGSWVATGELVDAHNLSQHEIQAVAITTDGERFASEKYACTYNQQNLAVSKVTMHYGAWGGTKYIFDFLNPSGVMDHYSFTPMYTQFTYTIEFTENDPDRISDVILYVKTSKTGWHPLKATYEKSRKCWIAMGEFGQNNDGDLPINVSVDFQANEPSAPLDNDYLKQQYAWLDSFKEEPDDYTDKALDTRELDAMSDEALLAYLEAHQEEPPTLEEEEEYGLDEKHITIEDGTEVITKRATCEGLSEEQFKQDETYKALITTAGTYCYMKQVEGLYDFVDFTNNERLTMTYEAGEQLRAFEWLFTIDWERLSSMSATMLGFINTFDDYSKYFTNFLQKLQLSSKLSYNKAKAGYETWTMRIAVVQNRYDNAVDPLWKAKWKGELGKARVCQKAYKAVMNNNLKAIQAIKGLMTVVGSGIDLACTARKGYQAVQDWTAIFHDIQGTDCPGMGRLAAEAWAIFVPIYTSYFSACMADIASLAALKMTITAEASLILTNISIWGGVVGDLANMYGQGFIRNQIPTIKCNQPEPWDKPDKRRNGGQHKSNNMDKQYIIDPSGYVYAGVFSNRIEGAKATLFYKEGGDNPDAEGKAVQWDASIYAQENPLYTNAEGFYRWDVPEGLWQVKYEKQGYETTYSDWLPVPPPQLDVNVGMRALTEPSVQRVNAYPDAVEITFDQYMQPSTLTTETIQVLVGNEAVPGTLRLLNEEVSYEGNTDTYASKVRFEAEAPFSGTEVVVLVSNKVTNYAEIRMTEDYLQTIPIEKEIQEIVCEETLTMDQGTTRNLLVEIKPKEAGAGKQLIVTSGSPSLVSPESSTVTIDNEGKATVQLEGLLPGTVIVKLQVADTDKSKDIKVMVNQVEEIIMVANPTASLPSGSTVELGTTVTLHTETIGAYIYYTTNGSCPCDANADVLTYEGTPIVLDKVGTFTLKAMAKADGRADSEVAEYIYHVTDPTGIEAVDGNSVIIYPQPVRDRLHIRSPKPMRAITLLSMAGKALLTQVCDGNEDHIDVGHLSAGIYLLRIEAEDGTVTIRKFIKA